MTSAELLDALPNVLVFAFVVVNMLALGMELTLREIVAPLRDGRLTAKALLANFVLVPLTAYLLIAVFHPVHGRAIGLVLLACSAGDPFVTKLSQSAKGEAGFTLAMLALLSVITIGYMPLVLPLLLPGVSVDPVDVAKPLVTLMLLPLAAGLVTHRAGPRIAERVAPYLDRLASLLIYSAVLLFAIVHYRDIVATFGSRAILMAVLLVLSAFGYGFALGGPDRKHRGDLAVSTGWRGVSAAMAVGIKNFPADQDIFTMAIIMVLVSAAILMPLSATWLRRWNEGGA